MSARSIARCVAAVTAASAGVGCTSQRPLRTAPAPGMKVVVELSPSRSIAVRSISGDLELFDRVAALNGAITRVNADTVWLADVGVQHDGQWSWTHDSEPLAVAGIGASADIRQTHLDAGRTAWFVVGALAVATALLAAQILVELRHDPNW